MDRAPPSDPQATRRNAWPAPLVAAAVLFTAACDEHPAPPTGPSPRAALFQIDAPALATDLAAGRVTAEDLTRAVLERIAALDDAGPTLNAIIEINPDALEIARQLDRRLRAEGPVGPLHGVPVVLKANIDTADRMATSAGSIALANHHARADADVVARLREAGAVIVAKANLSEWANFRSFRSTSGWSSLGGQTKHPYALDRNPCGSSSGSAVAVAARLAPLAVGTETSGSIICPAGVNGIVGIKPTLGLVSQDGIIPIAASYDTAGPMARTVRGAALLLTAMQAQPPPSGASDVGPGLERFAFLDAGAARSDLQRLRIGVVRDYTGAGSDARVEAALDGWLDTLRGLGAEVVDPVELELPASFDAAVLEVLLYEFKAGIDEYLGTAGGEADSLEDLIDFNAANPEEVMPHFGQEIFLMARERGEPDDAAYRSAVAGSRDALLDRLQSLFEEHDLAALVVPANAPAWETDWARGDRIGIAGYDIAAVSGWPSVTVPGGLVGGLPVGLAFVGEPWSEPLLVEIAAVFEQATGPMLGPEFEPTLGQ